MTLEIYKELRNDINTRWDKADNEIKSFPRNASGLVEINAEYLMAKRNYDKVFKELQILNKATSNKIKKEYRNK